MDCPAGHQARAGSTSLELADIFRSYPDRLGSLRARQRQAVRAITACRTAALGGHLQQCDRCGYRQIFYNSCRDRHCPKCQSLSAARWMEARRKDLLPVEYFHLVLTVPSELHFAFRAAPKRAYGLLFSAAAETLQQVALNPKRLGARIGITTVLHTWTQTLLFHPHLHCIVPGGGLNPDGDRWVSAKPGFFLPVKILSRVFRGKLLSKFQEAFAKGQIRPDRDDAGDRLKRAARKRWMVYSKPPFCGPDQVLRYLSRYTHRIAISNDRIVSMHDGRVTFRWRDRRDGGTVKHLELPAREFLRRFLQHVLPSKLVRIRHFGLLANRVRQAKIKRCRRLLNVPQQIPQDDDPAQEPEPWQQLLLRLTGVDPTRCPRCHCGSLTRVQIPAPSRPCFPGRATSP